MLQFIIFNGKRARTHTHTLNVLYTNSFRITIYKMQQNKTMENIPEE